jgi:hypothetical protein
MSGSGRILSYLPSTIKNMTSQEQRKSIEQSLEKFKAAKRNHGQDANIDQNRYLDEMLSMGEKALDVAVPRNQIAHQPVPPFSLSWSRVGKRLLLVTVVFIVTFAVYAFLGWS